MPRRAHESEDLPARRTRRVRWSEAAWDGRRLVRRCACATRASVTSSRPRTVQDRAREERDSDGHRSTAPGTHVHAACASATATSSRSTSTRSSGRSTACAGDLDDVDPMRVATRTISGLYDGATTAELDELSIRTAAALIGEEPKYSRLAARLLAAYIDKEVRNQDIDSFTQSIALGHAEGLIGDETAALRQRQRPQARRRHRRRRATGGSSTSACARSTTATCCATRDAGWSSRRRSTSSCGSPAACRRRPGEAIELLPADVVARLPAERRRRCSTPAPGTPQMSSLLPARLARATTSTRSTTATRRSPSCRSSPAASASPSHRVRVARLADPRHQRPVQRHRAVAARRSTRRSPRSTRAAGARARPASTSRRGTPTSRSSSSCATTPATTPAAPTTSTWPTGSPTCSWSGSRRTGRGRCSTPKQVPTSPTCTATSSTRPTAQAEARGPLRAAGPGPRAVRPDDAHARPDRQRLDDLQGRRPTGPATRPARPGNVVHLSNLCTEILEVTSRRRDRGLQPRLDQPRPRT